MEYDYKSQIGQDKYFIEKINNGKMNGYFVDIGAHDGVLFSNTYCLENHLNWNGICIEANDMTFEKLQKNRNCICVNECVYEVSGIELELEIPLSHEIPEGNDMLVRIKSEVNNKNDYWHNQFKETKILKKISKTLTDIFNENNVPNVIDYLSIDIEGAELHALKGLDFEKYTIKFLTLEWQGRESKKPYLESIKSFLHNKGYKLHRMNLWDVEFEYVNPVHVNSFDVFDTLLARKTENPHGIFKMIEKEFPFPHFYEYRCNAEKYSNGTFDSIYQKFKELYNIDNDTCEQLKEYELITEMKNSYLVETNCNRVKDGDILISDMYLNENDIMKILKFHGFNKKVKLYASPNGKSSGRIWPTLMDKYTIKLHLGDNKYSDVDSPSSFGIKSELTTVHKFSDTEHFFYNNGYPDFGLLIREFRHKNPYHVNTNDYQLYNDQILFNIPCLIMYSQSLYEIMVSEKRTKLLLLTRDGCLLKHIFKLLYPYIECVELQSSRKVHRNPNEEYKNYLKNIYDPNTCLISDLFGAFESGRELYKELFGTYPRVHLFGFNNVNNHLKYDNLTYLSSKYIETFNVDIIGSLFKLENTIFYRNPILEYHIHDAQIYKDTVMSFCEFMKNKKKPYIFPLITNFLNKIIVKSHIRIKHSKGSYLWEEHPTFLEIADYYTLDKGSNKNCGHKYVEYYEQILKPFTDNQKNMSILEIGLRNYNEHSLLSFNFWDTIFSEKLHYVGFDKNEYLLKYNNPQNNVYIYPDLHLCKNHMYYLIIDDSSHSSESQQTVLKTVWNNLKSGGFYCIESLHWQPYNDHGMKTLDLLLEWKNGNRIHSEFINKDEAETIISQISTIDFYPSKSKKWPENCIQKAFCVIKKN